MNVAFFLIPKINVAYLYDDQSLRQGLEKMRAHGYTAIPVLNRDNIYVGTVSEGDFLWYLVDSGRQSGGSLMKDAEKIQIQDIMRGDRNRPVLITAGVEELLDRAENQNFVPVVDDRNMFIGIVTRKDIIMHYAPKAQELSRQERALA